MKFLNYIIIEKHTVIRSMLLSRERLFISPYLIIIALLCNY